MSDNAAEIADLTEAEADSEAGRRGPVSAASDRLVDTVAGLDPESFVAPSLCPGWSRAHVIAHVARNADALTNLLTWARTGTPTYQYATPDSRNADIAATAALPADELVTDLRDSVDRFAQAVVDLPDDAWSAEVRKGPGGTGDAIPARRVMWMRLLEVEVHHVDLDAGYSPADWPAPFVDRALGEVINKFRRHDDAPPLTLDIDGRSELIRSGGPTVAGTAPAILAWLIGRSAGDDLTADHPLPDLPGWM